MSASILQINLAPYYYFDPWHMLPLFQRRDELIRYCSTHPTPADCVYKEIWDIEEGLGWHGVWGDEHGKSVIDGD